MSKKTLFLKARKPLTYGTRHMVAGEVFEVPLGDAYRLLKSAPVRLSKTRRATELEPVPVPVPVSPVVVDEPSDELTELRAVYESAAGKAPDGRWGVARLQEEMAFLSKDED